MVTAINQIESFYKFRNTVRVMENIPKITFFVILHEARVVGVGPTRRAARTCRRCRRAHPSREKGEEHNVPIRGGHTRDRVYNAVS